MYVFKHYSGQKWIGFLYVYHYHHQSDNAIQRYSFVVTATDRPNIQVLNISGVDSFVNVRTVTTTSFTCSGNRQQ